MFKCLKLCTNKHNLNVNIALNVISYEKSYAPFMGWLMPSFQIFIWATKNMKKLVWDVFLNCLQGFANCILKLPLIHTKTWPKV